MYNYLFLMKTDLKSTFGIYAIRNEAVSRMYVGATVAKFAARFSQHRIALRNGTHHNVDLQADWNEYGEDAFLFEVMETLTSEEECYSREQAWIDFFWKTHQLYNRARSTNSPLRKPQGRPVGTKRATGTRTTLQLSKNTLDLLEFLQYTYSLSPSVAVNLVFSHLIKGDFVALESWLLDYKSRRQF